jgi:hypothetical protein
MFTPSPGNERNSMIVNGPIGKPVREVIVTPEREPVPERVTCPDSPEGLPERTPEKVS